MQVIIAFAFLATVIILGISAVTSYFNSGSRRYKKELTSERKRSTLAQNALREISAGAEMPVFVANDALLEISKTYTSDLKEIQ